MNTRTSRFLAAGTVVFRPRATAWPVGAVLAAGLLGSLPALAQAAPVANPGAPATVLVSAAPAPADSVLSLNASAAVDVAKDWMSVTLSTTREGTDAQAVQSQLKQALDAALAEARKATRPAGGLEVATGAFSMQPRYSSKGQLNGWQGTAELLIEGRDMPAIAALIGRIPGLAVARLSTSLSREAREKVEGEVSAQAIARFRARAADYAKAFGGGPWSVREVTVQLDMPAPPVRMYAAKAMLSSGPTEDLPVEAGKASVTATVSGTVTLGR